MTTFVSRVWPTAAVAFGVAAGALVLHPEAAAASRDCGYAVSSFWTQSVPHACSDGRMTGTAEGFYGEDGQKYLAVKCDGEDCENGRVVASGYGDGDRIRCTVESNGGLNSRPCPDDAQYFVVWVNRD